MILSTNNWSIALLQVERRIVTQLALAHERDQLEAGCQVRFRADLNLEQSEASTLSMTIKKTGGKKIENLSEPFSNNSPLNID